MLVLVFAVLVFVPVKYVYPSRTETLWYLNMTLATLWLVLFGVIVATLPDAPLLSLGYLAYYAALSLWLTVRGGNPVAPAGVDPAP